MFLIYLLQTICINFHSGTIGKSHYEQRAVCVQGTRSWLYYLTLVILNHIGFRSSIIFLPILGQSYLCWQITVKNK